MSEPGRRIFLFCEGAKTEPAYFEALGRQFDRVQVRITGVGGVPSTVADQAIRRAKKLRRPNRGRSGGRSSFEETDQVWAIFGRDKHPNGNVLARCRANNVEVALSDPCFDLWLLLHLEAFDKPANASDVQARLHQLLPAYHHRQSPAPSFAELLQSVETAEQRAHTQMQNREREGKPSGNPSTAVYRVTCAIRDAHRVALLPTRAPDRYGPGPDSRLVVPPAARAEP